MKRIQSKENPIYKSALKLKKKKYRDSSGAYLLEGVKPLRDAFQTGIAVKTVFLPEGGVAPEGCPPECCIVLEEKLFRQLSDTETSQGVIAVVEKKRYTVQAFMEAVGMGNIVILDRLQDPGNIGTIIRTAEAAGYRGVVVMAGSGDPYAPKVVRSAAGSLLRMPVMQTKGFAETVELVEQMGKQLVVTCLEGAESCFEADLKKDIALVIGNEGQGVSRELMDTSHRKVKIPMEGAIESLNAAVAAGILMYQSQKRN